MRFAQVAANVLVLGAGPRRRRRAVRTAHAAAQGQQVGHELPADQPRRARDEDAEVAQRFTVCDLPWLNGSLRQTLNPARVTGPACQTGAFSAGAGGDAAAPFLRCEYSSDTMNGRMRSMNAAISAFSEAE